MKPEPKPRPSHLRRKPKPAHIDLRDLARRIQATAAWEDLVLPPERISVLREIVVHARHGLLASAEGEADLPTQRGAGIRALFGGPPGTGKHLAADVVACDLRRDLMLVKTRQVLADQGSWVDENLRFLTDVAQQEDAILLFDRVDPYMVQRDWARSLQVHLQDFRGLALLISQAMQAVPDTFLNGVDFVVSFPFPDIAQREEIWRRVLKPHSHTKGLDFHKLAQLELPGCHIRDIALQASFLATEQQQPVNIQHLRRAARTLYQKLGRSMTMSEHLDWN